MIGEVIGNYRIVAELGKGGMGLVYRAEHVQLGRPAALKMLLPQFSSNPAIVQRFFNEARAASAIDHPGIIEVFDYGTHTDGAAYIVMALLKGESLEQRLRRGPLSPLDAAGIIAQVLGALAAAHARGIIHRDLKPDNIFLVPHELMPGGIQVKLLDFGIAKLSGGEVGSQTQTGVMMGTPAYMSPEQCMGKSDLDHRTDLYAIGCILYQLLARRPPFVSDEGTGMMIAAHIRDVPADPRTLNPHIPEQLAAIVMRLLEKEPAARFQSALETRDALAAIGVSAVSRPPAPATAAIGYAPTVAPQSGMTAATGLPGSTTASGSAAQLVPPVQSAQPTRRRTGAFVFVGILLAALSGVGVWAALRRDDARVPATVAVAPAAGSAPVPAADQPPGSSSAVAVPAASPPATPAVTPSPPRPTSPPAAPLPQPAVPLAPAHESKANGSASMRAPQSPVRVPPQPPAVSGPVPKLEVKAKTYTPGGSIEISFAAPMPSPSTNRAWVTVVPAGSKPEYYDQWVYVLDNATNAKLPVPAAPGAYEVRLHTDFPRLSTNLRASVPITVQDNSAAPAPEYRFMVATRIARTGGLLEITFPGPLKAAPNERFWIAVCERGTPDTRYGTWEYVADGARELSLKMPATAGDYEIRLHANYPRLQTNVVHRVSIRVED